MHFHSCHLPKAENLNDNQYINHTNNVCLWLNAICQINLCLTSLLLLLILDPFVPPLCFLSPSFFFLMSSLLLPPPFLLSCSFHTDAPSRPAWQEWWDVSSRYYNYPNILHCKQGYWLGGRGFWEGSRLKMAKFDDALRREVAAKLGALQEVWTALTFNKLSVVLCRVEIYKPYLAASCVLLLTGCSICIGTKTFVCGRKGRLISRYKCRRPPVPWRSRGAVKSCQQCKDWKFIRIMVRFWFMLQSGSRNQHCGKTVFFLQVCYLF